jgi:protein-tyrosine-phosphatase
VKIRVLFLCATNGVQSPMAEALLKRADSQHFEVTSAGMDCGEIHPTAIDVMREISVDLDGKTTTPIRDVQGKNFDFVITLCDRARSSCPRFGDAEVVHWKFDDPSTQLDLVKQKRMFQSLRDQIAQRIRLFALVQVRFSDVKLSATREPSLQPHMVH